MRTHVTCNLGLFIIVWFLASGSGPTYGQGTVDPRPDGPTAHRILPYAVMANGAYNNPIQLGYPGWRRLPFDWEPILHRQGMTLNQIKQIKSLGFSATVYRNDSTGEITIAYRGTDQLRDLALAHSALQFKAAAAVASGVKQIWPRGTPISLTGHSLGGALASHAGIKANITNVYTFNAFRSGLSTTGNNPNQINVNVRNDPIGNPRTTSILGWGKLPGKSFTVPSTTERQGLPISRWRSAHELSGIIGGLAAEAKSARSLDRLDRGAGAQTRSFPPSSIHPTVAPTQAPQTVMSTPPPRPRPFQAIYRPGGISLSKAAADKMALHINIDGLVYRDGQIVVAGSSNKATRIDAALFMTSLRLACEPSGDPYFSLDPFDGQAWTDQGREATAAIWNAIKEEFTGDPGNTKFAVQSFSVRQRYPALWAELAPRYPELRTKLVFGPEWLRETRFGEILYKADVLLKELVSGVSIVQPSTPLRAETVANYVSPQERSAARGILESDRTKDPQKWEGHRLWFDLMPQAQKDKPPAFQHPDKNIDRRKHRELYSILRARGLVGQRTPNPTSRATVYAQGDVTDLSQVYPKMFVRIHDHVTRKDLEGASPDRDLLSWDVNERTERYAEAYLELRDLIDIFRAYIAAAKIVKQDQSICKHIPGTLMPAEKVATPLPAAHPSEIIITVAQYAWSERRAKRWQLSTGTLNSGGIGLRGKQFLAVAGVERETALIKEVKQDLANGVPAPGWKSKSGRQYIAFSASGREPPRRVPIVAAGAGK